MKFEVLLLAMIFGCCVYLYYMAFRLKSLIKVIEVPSKPRLASHSANNVTSLSSHKKEVLLDQSIQLLAKTESYEKHFEHASKEEIIHFDMEFRFERRRLLKALKNIGYFDRVKQTK
ncbi:hypothetical protein L1D59_08485 [Pseudoalteromonas piscicida]|uniref:hypothetical protein n=1 Tax=Pseudoalteromonas piscicida TaxID=43662 RepID=UPI001EFED1BE|nr:hypothetical protein [Pseudoalteromonas piscicida]MCG9768645.1 hypothetical protein [Pseudoalteromonas piscicida]